MKVLIAYFSRNDENYYNDELHYLEQGNTKKIAEIIHHTVNGDIFEIKPASSYSENFKECCLQAKADIEYG